MDAVLAEIFKEMEKCREYIQKSLERLPDAALWARPREGVNSLGNLCLHLAGNESHYIGRVIGKTGYERDRPGEFEAEGGFSRQEVQRRLDEARQTTARVFGELSAATFHEPVESNWPPEPTTLRVILHVAQHYAFHTGQIVLGARLAQEGAERILPWGH